MRTLTFFFVLLSLCFPIMANAAIVEPVLEGRLWAAKPADRFSVIFKLHNPRDIAALDQELHTAQASLAERHITVIDALKANAADTQGPVLAVIEAWKGAGEVGGYTAYWIENLIVVYGSAKAILSLAADRAVQSVGPNFTVDLIEPVGRGPRRDSFPNALDSELLTSGQNAIHATQVNRELQINGQGVLVANCDTGVDGNHPALASRWRGTHAPAAECWRSFIGANPNFPTDTYGHGTHVMGTICGRAINGNDTITVGSAPLAEWIACDPINQGVGPNFNQDVFDAFEWFADPDGDPNTMEDVPDVVQNSWGVNGQFPGYTDCFADWNTVITNCEAVGVVVTWSAGNEGPGAQTLRTPATFQLTPTQIFSVGAVDANNYPNTPHPIASFSSRGPAQCEPNPTAIKPEISAPGVNVYSSVPGGGYDGGWSGTSMAGPHVAGCVALMRQACPDCDPQTIKEAIMATAIDNGYPPTGEDNTHGWGFIDCYQAVLSVATLGRVDGYITSSGSPLAGVRVESLTQGVSTLSVASGYYVMAADSGTHTIRYTKFGYETITVPGVQIVQGDTAHVDQSMTTVPMGILAGRVTTQVGIPVQNALVVIRNTPYDTLTSDADGRVYQANLPATMWQIWVQMIVNTVPPRLYTSIVDVDIQAGDTTFVDLPITVTLVEPIGPDAYGYYAYDRYDRDLPAPSDWVELDPDLGNPGIPFEFVHHDSSVFFRTPFTIGFYGTDRDTLTVNPNGWMLPGEIHGGGAVNTAIPSNGFNDPPGIIASVWDDFRVGLGARQFSYYDTTNGRWILEFVDQRLVTPNNRFLNWQVQFLDPARHPTMTGDGDIVVMYHLMQYLNGCTIGIENPDEQSGLQVRYNAIVDSTTWPVEDGAAIRYTTGHPSTFGHVAGTLTLYPSSNQITSAVIYAGGDMTNPAANGQFTVDSSAAAPVSVLLNLAGYEARRVNRVVVTENQTTNQNLAAWRLDPARNLAASQFNGNVTLAWHRPLCTESAPNPDIRYNIYDEGVRIASGLADTTFSNTFTNGDTIVFTAEAVYRYGTAALSAPLEITVDLAASEANTALPTVYALYQNYPNPFNPTTAIRLDMPERAEGALQVYDISGRLVRTLHDGALNAGRYTFSWDSRDGNGNPVSTGMYLCRFNSHSYVATQKMLLVK